MLKPKRFCGFATIDAATYRPYLYGLVIFAGKRIHKMGKQQDDTYSEKEAAARRDATIKHMIAMPPKPHSEMKIGKKKAKKAKPKKSSK